MTLAQIPGRADDAARQFESAIAWAPDDVRLRAAFADLLAKLGRVPEAIQQLEVAQTIMPDPGYSDRLRQLRNGVK